MKKIFLIFLSTLLVFSAFIFVPVSAEDSEYHLEVTLNSTIDVSLIKDNPSSFNGLKFFVNGSETTLYNKLLVNYNTFSWSGTVLETGGMAIGSTFTVKSNKVTLSSTFTFVFIEKPDAIVMRWLAENGDVVIPPCDGTSCSLLDFNTDGICDTCQGEIVSSVVGSYRPFDAPTYLPYFPLGFDDNSEYVIYRDTYDNVFMYTFTPISYLPVAYWNTIGSSDGQFKVESIDGNSDPIDTIVRYYKLVDGDTWVFQLKNQTTTTFFGNVSVDEVVYSTLTLYDYKQIQIYPPRFCDGSACDVSDFDVNGKCDDCGYTLLYSIRPTYTPNNWPSELPPPPLGFDGTSDYIITSEKSGGIYLFTWTHREEYSDFWWDNKVLEKNQNSIMIRSYNGDNAAYMNYYKYSYDSNSDSWVRQASSQSQYSTLIGVEGETTMVFSTLDIFYEDGTYFFPRPLWLEMEKVAQRAIVKMEILKVMKVLTVAGLGLLALLMGFHLLHKKFRTFLP